MAVDPNAFNNLEPALQNIFTYLKVQMIEELQRQGHVVNGKLMNSIESEIKRGTDFIQLDGTFIFYGRFVDTGRRKGVKKVPIVALEDWIRAKGFETDAKKIRGIAFAIQKSIHDKGISTPETWKGESTKGWMSNVLERNDKRIQDDIYNSVTDAMELIVFNMLKEIESKSTGNTVKLT